MNTRELRSEPATFQQHPTASLWVLWLQNRFEGTFPPCHPLFCSVTKRNLNSRSAHQFLRNSRVLMPDNSGALWLSPSPSNLQFPYVTQNTIFHNYFIVLFYLKFRHLSGDFPKRYLTYPKEISVGKIVYNNAPLLVQPGHSLSSTSRVIEL